MTMTMTVTMKTTAAPSSPSLLPSRSMGRRLDKAVQGVVKFKESLSRHTSLQVGGEADYFVIPACTSDLEVALDFARECDLPWMVLGNGTNTLFPDEGYRGLVIQVGPRLGGVSLQGDRLRAGGGASLAAVRRHAAAHGFGDLDFLVGIPGTLGGALAMNAGIPEASIGDLVEEVVVLTRAGARRALSRADCGFGYRASRIRRRGWLVLEATLRLGLSRRRWEVEALWRRRSRQPLGQPSPGCVFKNPPGFPSAGRLIERAGLKGHRVGGAQVSERHANFIVNRGGARSADVLKLIDIVREKVYKEFKVDLDLELQVVR